MSAPPDILRGFIAEHYESARTIRNRGLVVTVLLALVPAVLLSLFVARQGRGLGAIVLGGMSFVFLAGVFGVLALAIPLALHHVNIGRIQQLERRIVQEPGLVRYAWPLTIVFRRGSALRAWIYRGYQRVVLVAGGHDEQYVLWLLPARAAAIAAALPRPPARQGDFDRAIARAI